MAPFYFPTPCQRYSEAQVEKSEEEEAEAFPSALESEQAEEEE